MAREPLSFPEARPVTPSFRPLRLVVFGLVSGSLPLGAQSAGEVIARGVDLDRRHRHAEAAQVYLEASARAPDHPEILRCLAGQYLQLMGETNDTAAKKQLGTKALAAAEAARKIAPENAKVRLMMAIVYGRVALLEPPARQVEMSRLIKEEVDASLALDPNDSQAWYLLGRWNYEMASLNPLLRGMARVVFGKLPDAGLGQAGECFQKAISLGPPRRANHIELGRTYAAMGQKAEAGQQLNKGLAMTPIGKDDVEAGERGRKALERL